MSLTKAEDLFPSNALGSIKRFNAFVRDFEDDRVIWLSELAKIIKLMDKHKASLLVDILKKVIAVARKVSAVESELKSSTNTWIDGLVYKNFCLKFFQDAVRENDIFNNADRFWRYLVDKWTEDVEMIISVAAMTKKVDNPDDPMKLCASSGYDCVYQGPVIIVQEIVNSILSSGAKLSDLLDRASAVHYESGNLCSRQQYRGSQLEGKITALSDEHKLLVLLAFFKMNAIHIFPSKNSIGETSQAQNKPLIKLGGILHEMADDSISTLWVFMQFMDRLKGNEAQNKEKIIEELQHIFQSVKVFMPTIIYLLNEVNAEDVFLVMMISLSDTRKLNEEQQRRGVPADPPAEESNIQQYPTETLKPPPNKPKKVFGKRFNGISTRAKALFSFKTKKQKYEKNTKKNFRK